MSPARIRRIALGVTAVVFVAAGVSVAQYAPRAGRGRYGMARQEQHPTSPTWENDPRFTQDVFTFVRIKYSSRYDGYWSRRRGKFWTDAPDSDMNFSFRLQQMTSMKVEPLGPEVKIKELTDADLFNYPFIYIVEPGELVFTDDEVAALRRYLLNGGFLMVDDFWGVAEGENLFEQMKRVFPEYDAVELPFEHPIFHTVFPLAEKPQIPSVYHAEAYRGTNRTWEREDAKDVDYRAIFDNKGRMMVMICHNTDLGDGWEQEGASEYFFREFSEKKGYPMGINILVYAMTH
jgi:hypothetical protein